MCPTIKHREKTDLSPAHPPHGSRGRSLVWLAFGVSFALIVAVTAYSPARPSEAISGEPIAVLRTADFHALAFRPDDANIIFFGHHDGLMRSDNGGRSWIQLVQQPNFDVMGLVVSPIDPRRVYLAGHEILQISNDGGSSSQPLAHDLPDADIHGFAISPDDPRRLYAFVVKYGLFASDDGGSKWNQISDRWSGDIMALAAGPADVLLAGTTSGGVLKSIDGGKTWMSSNSGLKSSTVTSLAIAPNRSTFYAGGDAGLYRSDDLGANWRKLVFPGKSVIALAVSPSNPSYSWRLNTFVRETAGSTAAKTAAPRGVGASKND